MIEKGFIMSYAKTNSRDTICFGIICNTVPHITIGQWPSMTTTSCSFSSLISRYQYLNISLISDWSHWHSRYSYITHYLTNILQSIPLTIVAPLVWWVLHGHWDSDSSHRWQNYFQVFFHGMHRQKARSLGENQRRQECQKVHQSNSSDRRFHFQRFG